MLSIDDFKKIELEDRKIFKKIYKNFPPIHSDNVFTTLISWMDYGNYRYAFYKNNLLIMSNINGVTRFRPPIGKKNIDVFLEVMALAKDQDAKYPFGMISKDDKEYLLKEYPNLNFYSHRDFFEYVYLSSDLADLKGSDYSKIRNRLNKFHRKYEFEI